MSQPLRAALFDMDGTLIDSTGTGDRMWSQWADEHGVADRSFLETYQGRPGREVLAEILPADEVEGAFARIVEIESTDVEGVTATPGASGLLSAFAAGGHPHAIVTSSLPSIVAVRLPAAGLAAPAVIVTADQTPLGKPHPDPFLLGASLLGVPASAVVVFEDTPPGIQAARAAGAAFVVAVEGTHPASALAADVVVPDLRGVTVVDGGDGTFRLAFAR